MFKKIAYHLLIIIITSLALHTNAFSHLQVQKQKGDFIVTAKSLTLSPLTQSHEYSCQIEEPSILFKQKDKGDPKTLTSSQFCSLWQENHSFKMTPPNATLLFLDQKGNSYQMIFAIPIASATKNSLTLTAQPLSSEKASFLKNGQPVSIKEFMEGPRTLKSETLSLLIDDADGPDYDNPWDPS